MKDEYAWHIKARVRNDHMGKRKVGKIKPWNYTTFLL